jgi:hypothetical protein
MKHSVDVLRMKEREILKVRAEIEALRITVRLLSDEPTAKESQTPETASLDFKALELVLDSLNGL